MTLAETIFYAQVGIDKLNDEIEFQVRLHTDLKVAVLNAPHSERRGGGLYKIEDFIKNTPTDHKKISESEKSKRWLAAGNACMDVVEQHENPNMRRKDAVGGGNIRRCRT